MQTAHGEGSNRGEIMNVTRVGMLDFAVGIVALCALGAVGAAALQRGTHDGMADRPDARNTLDPGRAIRIHVVCASAEIPFTDIRAMRVGKDGKPTGDVRDSRPGSNIVRIPAFWNYRLTLLQTAERQKSTTGSNVLSFDNNTPCDVMVKCLISDEGLAFLYASWGPDS